MREDICEHMMDDDDLDPSDIGLKVSKGEATLNRTAEPRHAKRRAEDCAASVSGIKHVQNNLRLKESQAEGKTG
ncbi:BON domain-containing protein [Defluviimonas sp. WL0002]|uniref:BON domain-containing protein n=1 Tax=Albidovulum marisflavi TaxID=2984159 RepID=A0ABT2ZCG2_9RHOB|nr:BON domain-containing protein [Defluviimonas sp. WL0002]MCV2868838.1 BON domain-containing protein [Defluviimonas sp. WL0002]